MISKKVYYVIVLCLALGAKSYAQQNMTKEMKQKADSIKLFYLTEAAVRNPILRQVVVSTYVSGPGKIKSKVRGADFFEGKVAQARTNVAFTLPLVAWDKNSITGTFLYEHQQFLFSDVRVHNPVAIDEIKERNIYRNTVGVNIGFQRLDSLFGKNIVYTANINGLSGKKGVVQRFNFLGAAIINLKQTERSNLSVGLALNIDRSINIPVFPIVTYWRKFENGFDININLPQQAVLRKEFGPKLTGTIGTNMAVSNSFFQTQHLMALPQNLNYTELGLQNGIGIEYRLANKVMVGINAGIQTPLSSRAFEVGENANDYYIKNSMGSSPYVKLSVSLLPVIKSLF